MVWATSSRLEIGEDLVHLLVDARLSLRRTQASRSESLMMSLEVFEWAPTRTLSITERFGNSATFWKVRPMPISAIRCGGRDRMLAPSIRMSPDDG